MGRTSKLDVLDPEQQNDIGEYFKEHSSRETMRYIEEKYNIKISHVSITKFIEKAFKKAPQEIKILQYTAILAAQDVLTKFHNIYDTVKGDRAKMAVLSKEADYITALLKVLPHDIPEGKIKSEEKQILSWQEKDGQRIHTASKTETIS